MFSGIGQPPSASPITQIDSSRRGWHFNIALDHRHGHDRRRRRRHFPQRFPTFWLFSDQSPARHCRSSQTPSSLDNQHFETYLADRRWLYLIRQRSFLFVAIFRRPDDRTSSIATTTTMFLVMWAIDPNRQWPQPCRCWRFWGIDTSLFGGRLPCPRPPACVMSTSPSYIHVLANACLPISVSAFTQFSPAQPSLA